MSDATELTTMQVAPILAQASDRWRLTGPYVEQVWAEILGPTAILLARRLGRLLEELPDGVEIECADLAKSVGVARVGALMAPTVSTDMTWLPSSRPIT